jgi:hypothetical protein
MWRNADGLVECLRVSFLSLAATEAIGTGARGDMERHFGDTHTAWVFPFMRRYIVLQAV